MASCASIEDAAGVSKCVGEALEPIEQFPDVAATGNYGCNNVASVTVSIVPQKLVEDRNGNEVWIDIGSAAGFTSFDVTDGEQVSVRQETFCENGTWQSKMTLSGKSENGETLFGDRTSHSDEVNIRC